MVSCAGPKKFGNIIRFLFYSNHVNSLCTAHPASCQPIRHPRNPITIIKQPGLRRSGVYGKPSVFGGEAGKSRSSSQLFGITVGRPGQAIDFPSLLPLPDLPRFGIFESCFGPLRDTPPPNYFAPCGRSPYRKAPRPARDFFAPPTSIFHP